MTLAPDLVAQKIACATCKWWTIQDTLQAGICRGAPPDGNGPRLTPPEEYCAVYTKRLTAFKKPQPVVRHKRASLTDPDMVAAVMDTIWRVYPERTTPHQFIPARAIVNELLDAGTSADELVRAAEAYATACRKDDTPPKFVKAIHNFYADNFWRGYSAPTVHGLTRDAWTKSGQDVSQFDLIMADKLQVQYENTHAPDPDSDDARPF